MPQQNKRTVKTYYRLNREEEKRLTAPSAPTNSENSVKPSLKVKKSEQPAENNNTALKKKKTIIIAAAAAVVVLIGVITVILSSGASASKDEYHADSSLSSIEFNNVSVSASHDSSSEENTSHEAAESSSYANNSNAVSSITASINLDVSLSTASVDLKSYSISLAPATEYDFPSLVVSISTPSLSLQRGNYGLNLNDSSSSAFYDSED